jgi:phosphonate transport system substrate-binding protein
MRLPACFQLIIYAILLTACGQDSDAEKYQPTFSERPIDNKVVYLFGVHPLHNPTQLQAVYGPLVDYLNAHIPNVEFKLEASRNYAAYEEKLYSKHFQFALPNSYQTIEAAKKGYRIFGKMGDDDNFRGIILIRQDSGITKVTDLKGKAVSYPAPTALAATMLPQYFLHTHGINVNKDIENRYVGSQESSIMNVYLGQVAAAATWPLPWKIFLKDQPEKAAELEVKWETPSLPNNGLVARQDISPTLVNQVAELLFSLHTHEDGKTILARMPLSRFEVANDDTFNPVRQFINQFTTEVRTITQP